jgi:hypothetical protein
MNLELISLIIETLGTILIAFAALRVHHRVLHEHDIDDHVFQAMKFEQFIGVLGVFLVIGSFIIEITLLA